MILKPSVGNRPHMFPEATLVACETHFVPSDIRHTAPTTLMAAAGWTTTVS